jgi:predicted Zn-dependent peptidase
MDRYSIEVKNMKISLLVVNIVLSLPIWLPRFAMAEEAFKDPFLAIEYLEMDNGLKVFLAPSADVSLTSIRLEIDVGYQVEDKSNWGVSHLLEHVLFRDKDLKDEMTYLQLIREAGGEANGSTESRQTSYYASIPNSKSEWLLDSFAQMLLKPSFLEEYVAKEKGTVELERGRPGPVSEVLGFNPMDFLKPNYLNAPDFWQSEFNVKRNRDGFTLTEEQLSTRRLTLEQVTTHYQDYYYPANMRLFIAGKFDRATVMRQIGEKWASIPKRVGKLLSVEPLPKAVIRPYRRPTVTAETPEVSLGTKLVNADLASYLVVDSYTEYLAHRLMKEIRNRKGQTYTASSDSTRYKGAGYSFLHFETPKENIVENIAFAKEYFHNEAEKGALTQQQLDEAKELFLSKYRLVGKEAKDLLWFASVYQYLLREDGKFTSPYHLLSSMSLADYNDKLREAFKPDLHYEVIAGPPLWFSYDYMLLFVIIAVLSFKFLKRGLTKEFHHDRIRWIRKLQFPPLKFVELVACVIAALVYAHVSFLYDSMFRTVEWLQSSVFIAYYLNSVGEIFLILLVAQGILSVIPRKLMIMDSQLVIKTLSYYSTHIPLSEISSVETIRSLRVPLSFATLRKVGFRFYFFDPKFWHKGILVNRKNGKSYFFSMNSPEKASLELTGFLPSQIEQTREHIPSRVA